MRLLLDECEKLELETRLKKSKDLSEWKWIFAMIGYEDGLSIEELADLLRLSNYTVESYPCHHQTSMRNKNFFKFLTRIFSG